MENMRLTNRHSSVLKFLSVSGRRILLRSGDPVVAPPAGTKPLTEHACIGSPFHRLDASTVVSAPCTLILTVQVFRPCSVLHFPRGSVVSLCVGSTLLLLLVVVLAVVVMLFVSCTRASHLLLRCLWFGRCFPPSPVRTRSLWSHSLSSRLFETMQ